MAIKSSAVYLEVYDSEQGRKDNIHCQRGTLGTFQEFLKEAHGSSKWTQVSSKHLFN